MASAATRRCAPSTSTRWRRTCRCGRTRTASATASGSAGRWAPRSDRPDAGFYGHLIPSKVAYNNPYEFTDLTFYHSEHGVLLNLEGQRFCDETIGDHLNTLYVLDQPEARALLVYDQRVHDEWMMAPYVEGVEPLDKFQLAYRRSARAAVADEIEEFEALPDEWGYPGPASRDTLLEFNRQCEAGDPEAGPEARRGAARRPPRTT